MIRFERKAQLLNLFLSKSEYIDCRKFKEIARNKIKE